MGNADESVCVDMRCVHVFVCLCIRVCVCVWLCVCVCASVSRLYSHVSVCEHMYVLRGHGYRRFTENETAPRARFHGRIRRIFSLLGEAWPARLVFTMSLQLQRPFNLKTSQCESPFKHMASVSPLAK